MNTKRGSALLIVLGFLSFMVVSAVAFSIYMRSERQPSSAMRRSVATRYLVKAALARAIARVDDAIRADPYPGVKNADSHRRDKNSGGPKYGGYYDKWLGRVFMPPEPPSASGEIPDASDDEEGRLASPNGSDGTVSVLNLEALGYLPPCLVNDVRYLSRLSWAAKWDYFNFDCGRYAFCAVDVSDFFDLNRMPAATNRNSSAPISVSYLFADADKTAQGAAARATTFQTLLQNARNQASLKDYPFTSMLDYNLGVGAAGSAQAYAPFYNYIGRGNSDFYAGQAADEDGRRAFLNLPFVTDSWSGPAAGGVLSLADGAQPFDSSIRLDKKPEEYKDIAVIGQKVKDQIGISRNPSRLNFNDAFGVLLYDYLDRNDVPASLSLPCVERTPMVAAIEPQNNFQFGTTVTVDGPTLTTSAGGGSVKTTVTTYKLSNALFQRPPELRTAIVFPFKRFKGDLNRRYHAKAIMKVFFVEDSANLNTRPGSTAANALRPTDLSAWNGNSTMGNGIITLVSDWTPVNAAQDVTRSEQVLLGSGGLVSIPFANVPNPDDPAYSVLEIKTEETTSAPNAQGQTSTSQRKFYRSLFSPLDSSMQAALPNAWTLYSGTFPTAGKKYKMQVAVWVRITDENKTYTVDLVPACLTDDAQLNNMRNIPVDATAQAYGFAGSQAGEPLMRFDVTAANGLEWTDTAMASYASAQQLAFAPEALHCVDPRYNYAPECWYAPGDGTAKEAAKWYANLKSKGVFGTGGRDPDPFMFVSNQGYLQSVGEFAFLPLVCDMDGGDILPVGGFGGVTSYATEPSGVAGYAKLAWKTFRLYPGDGENATDGLYDYNVADRTQGTYVSPYTTSETVFLGALANTPWDYLVASTNDLDCSYANSGEPGIKDGVANLEDALKLCFNETAEDSNSRIAADKMRDVAAAMQDKLRSDANWTNAYDSLTWSYDATDEANAKKLFGVDTGVYLHSVDRKFLYSFWRNSFGNRQQLFLVFVRAESSALGSGQLGGRAVALVWRDPNPPKTAAADKIEDRSGNGYQRPPHRTRILFYHQFE